MNSSSLFQDTIAADKEDDEVDADEDAGHGGSSVSHDAIVHDGIPVLTCQNLREVTTIKFVLFFLNSTNEREHFFKNHPSLKKKQKTVRVSVISIDFTA